MAEAEVEPELIDASAHGLKRAPQGQDALEAAPAKRHATSPYELTADGANAAGTEQGDPQGRICFPFLNHGACARGELCKFRHLDQDHPDAIADRVRTGHINKLVGRLPAEKVAELQKLHEDQRANGLQVAPGQKGGALCFGYLNTGRCDHGEACKFRHVPADHPDAVADRMRRGEYNKIPQHANPLIDQNPNVQPGESRICFSFLNKGTCAHTGCAFRHLLPGHPDACADRMSSSGRPNAMQFMQQAQQMQAAQMVQYQQQVAQYQQQMAAFAGAAGEPPAVRPMAQLEAELGGAAMAPFQMQQHAAVAAQQQQAAVAAVQQQQQMQQMQQMQMASMMGGNPAAYAMGAGGDPAAWMALNQQQQMWSQQLYGGAGAGAGGLTWPAPQGAAAEGAGERPTLAMSEGESRICFPFLNKGTCARGQMCKFRHLEQGHPDAIADRMRTGHTNRLPAGMAPEGMARGSAAP